MDCSDRKGIIVRLPPVSGLSIVITGANQPTFVIVCPRTFPRTISLDRRGCRRLSDASEAIRSRKNQNSYPSYFRATPYRREARQPNRQHRASARGAGRIPRLVEKYKKALLAAAFQDGFGIESAASCFVSRLLSTAVVSTFYGPRIAKEAYVSSGIPTLRTTDIGEWGRLCPQNPPQVNVSEQERLKWAFKDGDLMVTSNWGHHRQMRGF